MPIPINITWFQADRGAIVFEFVSTNHRSIAVNLTDCHQEIVARPSLPPSEVEPFSGMGAANYLLKRSTWIQERLLNLYVTAIRGGVSNQGRFYGAFQEQGVVIEMDGVSLDGQVVYITEGIHYQIYRIGLLYTPEPISNTPVNTIEVARKNLPDQVLPRHANRHAYDHVSDDPPEPLRRSRYERPPVI